MNQEKFNEVVNLFKIAKDKDGNNLNMDYLLINQNNHIYLHNFKHKDTPSDIRSISKTILTLVTEIVIDLSKQGKYPHFDEETYIFPILKDAINLTNLKNKKILKQVKVKHLLNHTVGYDQVLLMRDDIAHIDPFTYLDYLVDKPLIYKPGEHYLYSNAGFYLLSAVLQEFVKEDLLQFINRHLFEPLAIKNYHWEKYGNYLAGATRLWMYPEDLLKIGELIIKKGLYKDKRIISSKQIEKMLLETTKTKSVDTPNAIFRRYAYASGIWLAKEPIFFGHGTDGQTLIMISEKKSIIITLAQQNDVVALENLINKIITEYL